MAIRGNGARTTGSSRSRIEAVERWYSGDRGADFIGPQTGDHTPILYLSGCLGTGLWDEARFTEVSGANARCFSYAYVGADSPLRSRIQMESLDWCRKNKVRVFIDSGAHSFHNIRIGKNQGKQVSKADREKLWHELMLKFSANYVNYIKNCYADKLVCDFYVTFDAVKDCQFIWDITHQYFDSGIYPIPVYHGDRSLDYVRRYIGEGHKLIGVGCNAIGKPSRDAKRRYYENVLSECYKLGAMCHGFAATGDIMFQLPWYSVDSSATFKAAIYGKIMDIIPERQRVGMIHVSTRSTKGSYGTIDALPRSVFRHIRDKVEREGFDLDVLRENQFERCVYNTKVLVRAVKLSSKAKLAWVPWKELF